MSRVRNFDQHVVHENPRASVAFGVFVAERCALLCAPVITHSHNLFAFLRFEWSEIICVQVFFEVQVCALRCAPVIVVFDLRLRFELRVTPSYHLFCVLRF